MIQTVWLITNIIFSVLALIWIFEWLYDFGKKIGEKRRSHLSAGAVAAAVEETFKKMNEKLQTGGIKLNDRQKELVKDMQKVCCGEGVKPEPTSSRKKPAYKTDLEILCAALECMAPHRAKSFTYLFTHDERFRELYSRKVCTDDLTHNEYLEMKSKIDICFENSDKYEIKRREQEGWLNKAGIAREIVETMNNALKADPEAIKKLMQYDVRCNELLGNNPDFRLQNGEPVRQVNIHSILNAITGANKDVTGTIYVSYNGAGDIMGFTTYKAEQLRSSENGTL